MNYFTPAWHSGELSIEECESVSRAYRAHVKGIVPKLPEPLGKLATQISLHDGLIRKVLLDHCDERLTIKLRCGNLQVGVRVPPVLGAGG